jgi:hypothetical protein
MKSEERARLRALCAELEACGRAWEFDARLVGNVRADEIVWGMIAILALLDALEAAEADSARDARGEP